MVNGRTVETMLKTNQEGNYLAGILGHDGRDVGLQSALGGDATFCASSDLGSYSNCLYEQASKAAAATRNDKASARVLTTRPNKAYVQLTGRGVMPTHGTRRGISVTRLATVAVVLMFWIGALATPPPVVRPSICACFGETA